MAEVDILLATYNGSKYLPDLLRSLAAQTFPDFRLIVRDDGSTDDSLPIIESWGAGRGAQLQILRDDRGGLGAAGNFGALLEASSAPYFMLCDQDDVWLPEKVARLLDLIRQIEWRRGTQLPILAHSDLVVVDSKLRPIHPSLRCYMRLAKPRPERLLPQLLVQAFVVGCSSIGNASLRRTALPIPTHCVMHDWWLALVAAEFGEIAELPQATVLYRQHGRNALGAKTWSLRSVTARVLMDPCASLNRTYMLLEKTQSQARAFVDRYGAHLSPESAALLHGYGHLRDRSLLGRKRFMIKNRIWGGNAIVSASFLALA